MDSKKADIILDYIKKKLDENNEVLKLENKNIGNNYYELLSKIDTSKLNELSLSMNNISDLSYLQKLNLENLKILDLSLNKITNYGELQKVNLKNLKILIINLNEIESLDSLINLKLEQL